MSDSVFKFTDATNRAVFRMLADGRCESYSVEAKEYKEWIAEGNIPQAADPTPLAPPPPPPKSLTDQFLELSFSDKARIRTFLGLV